MYFKVKYAVILIYVKKMPASLHSAVGSMYNKGPDIIKLFSCSTQLSMKISLQINMKMPTIVGIFIFISREIFMLSNVLQEKIRNC